MTMFHAVMIDECGSEFGADVEAPSKAEAYDALRDQYHNAQV